jgi:hypothetical protein
MSSTTVVQTVVFKVPRNDMVTIEKFHNAFSDITEYVDGTPCSMFVVYGENVAVAQQIGGQHGDY